MGLNQSSLRRAQPRQQELSGITRVCGVSEMGSSDGQSSIANQVSRSTIDLDLALGEVGNLAILLGIAGVANSMTRLIFSLTLSGSFEIESSITAVP